jgi:hypothetical protein
MHVDGSNFESTAAISRPKAGVTKSEPFYAREAFYVYDGGQGPLVGATAPGLNVLGFGWPALATFGQAAVWNGTAAGADSANGGQLQWQKLLDDQFAADGDVKTPQIIARIRAGKSGAGADNTNLALTCKAFVAKLGAIPVFVGSQSITLGAKVTGGNYAEIDEYDFDIGKVARAINTAHLLTQGSMLILTVGPDQAIGANLDLTIDGGQWITNRHEGLAAGKTRLGARG